MKKNDRIVAKNPNGGWDVKGGGGKRSGAHAPTQKQAIDRGRQIVGNLGGGDLSIQGRDGKIRAKDTIAPGNDPRKSKG
ncbi:MULTISPECIES: DUF2188 domain-containing protein [unclassified Rhodococcus (in: high G+C Gram-positive bacteria)]|uniref:DUF2188 domain-containing protein n=1 Tax=unclassified Rhodococcus (in: high G+C Gram-positive bacteria) TaxID=192944 RepID=UPI00163A9E0F|nr:MULTISPECIES: DUF2188 domain-containing protein [unclassified Rhodococcus (in: high G+C Gram-positive bacteria)]MBC2644768.1 DUF2188 domain-containing protein [Rhodococcus sp. 3A]MBC2898363.1 DUF2188 domain-containing protein [Rhodococcus sp. 4CII]